MLILIIIIFAIITIRVIRFPIAYLELWFPPPINRYHYLFFEDQSYEFTIIGIAPQVPCI